MLAEDVRKLEQENPSLKECTFILEELAFQSEIVRSIIYAVQEQLSTELCKDNQAILYAISDMIWNLDKGMQELKEQLFSQRKKGDTNGRKIKSSY